MVMDPEPLVILIPLPAVMVPGVYDDPFPIGICPLPGVEPDPNQPSATPRVPEDMLLALVASVVADGANVAPLVFVTVNAPLILSVASPLTA